MPIPRRAASGNAVSVADPNATHEVNTTEDRPRTLFRGTEDRARAFIQRNHPWLHVTPGDEWGPAGPMPDVVLKHPGDAEEYWNGERWVSDAELPAEPD